jgi:hypothetical protein
MGSSFPTDWNVLPVNVFEDFTSLAREPSEGRTMLVLMQLDENHRFQGQFRIRYVGGDVAPIRIQLGHLFPSLQEQLSSLYINFNSDNDDISPQRNATTTTWLDVEDLIRRKSVMLSNESGEEASPKELLNLLQASSTEKDPLGASIRWAVTMDINRKFSVQLQCLPTPAKLLNKAHLQGENTVSVHLGSLHVHAELFDDPTIDGPVPIFCSPDPAAALTYLLDHPSTCRDDISAVNQRFLRYELLSMMDALHYLKKKHRAAKGTVLFPPTRASKRRKTNPQTETGILFA